MYKHPSTVENMNILRSRGVYIIEPAAGELASGLEGKGRMEEPERIVAHVEAIFARGGSLAGKKMLISAGPTCEDIDPVRYITNHSSGKMGYAIAHEAANRGAEVTVVSGPVNVQLFHPNVKVVPVKSAGEMFEKCKEYTPQADMIVLCAAVADFTVKEKADKKIKREKSDYSLTLTPTQDIAAWVGANKREDTFLTGFALETNDELENAKGKLKRKNLDMIVLNSMQDAGAGFKTDTNKITIITSDGHIEEYPLKSKTEVAADIIDKMEC
jgi:phosphopantothenoylcysteine decarboxylase/phosphopantothenate--cysteine ligase